MPDYSNNSNPLFYGIFRNFIVLELDTGGRIKSHTDHWSVASLLETKFGWIYNIGRRAFGSLTSMIVGWVTSEKHRAIEAEATPSVGLDARRVKLS